MLTRFKPLPKLLIPVWLALLLLATGPYSPARAKQNSPKPVVMLLLDTSGSMEYSIEELMVEGVMPVCHDEKQEGFDYVKSRWVVAAEVLTGTFNDYWCSYDQRSDDPSREDYKYSWNEDLGKVMIPHVVANGTPVEGVYQRPDGLLDVYRDSIKFGLMAFDPRVSIAADQEGGFSYGPNKVWSGYHVNLGARNEEAPWGAFVAPPKSEDLDEVRTANESAQQQILAATPYMGTPISPLLDDALYFFKNDLRIREYDEVTGDGDPYHGCRSKNIILITDGQPTQGENAFGYAYSHIAASKLLTEGVKTYVVGFQLPVGNFAVLNKIAHDGGTEAAYIASNQSELISSLGEILVEIQGNEPSRTATVITNRTLNSEDKQYQFNASFSGSAASPLDQVGHLDQLVFRCDSSCSPDESLEDDALTDAAVCEYFSISDALNKRTEDRYIYTQTDGQLAPFDADNAQVSADVLDIPTTGDLAQIDPVLLPSGQMVFSGIELGDASNATVRAQYREQLISLIRGDLGSRRATIRMGAIVNGKPVVQTNINSIMPPVPSFVAYRNKPEVGHRPTVLFVQTHDGQLHAFHVSREEAVVMGYGTDLPEEDFGKELWAFIPKHILPKLQQLASGTSYLLDGTPVVQEVRLFKESPTLDIETEVERWRSVLVAGYRSGGRGYYALDITDPENPEFMWEIAAGEYCRNIDGSSPTCTSNTDFTRMGYSYSQPVVGSIYWSNDGAAEERAVAIFGGGQKVPGLGFDNCADLCPASKLAVMHIPPGNPENAHVICIPPPALKAHLKMGYALCSGSLDIGSGKSVYVVNLETGELIREFCNDCGNVSDLATSVPDNNSPIDCAMTGAVVAYDASIGGIITRVFIGDSCGQLWRLDMTNPNPDNWVLEMFHDAYDVSLKDAGRRPIGMEPTIAIGHTGNQVMLVYGTGNPDELLAPDQTDYIYSVSEFWNGNGFEAQVNWRLPLASGESPTSSPLVFDRVAYFTTQSTDDGYCSTGTGRLWGVDYIGNVVEPGIDDVIPAFEVDNNDDGIVDETVAYMSFENSELVGLELVQRPSCFADSDFSAGNTAVKRSLGAPGMGSKFPALGPSSGIQFGGASSPKVELVVQTGQTGTSSPSMEAPEGGGLSKTGNKAVQKVSQPAQSVFSTSWGMVFD